jgi:thiol-disulfide isomerase/thioredoxin
MLQIKSIKIMKSKKIALLVITVTFALFANLLKGQTYNIKVQIKELADSTLILGHYYTDKQFADDTLVLNNRGIGTFAGDSLLKEGLYFVLLPSGGFFEVFIDQDQDFQISSTLGKSAEDVQKNLSFKGSEINAFNLEHQKFMMQKSNQAKNINVRLKAAKTEEEKTALKDSMQILTKEVKSKMQGIIDTHPKSLLAKIMGCVKEIEVPDFPRDENGNIIDSMFQYNYHKKHYLDYVDFEDERLLLTPYYNRKIDNYLERIIIPAPDSLVHETKMIIDKTLKNEEMFKYTLQMIFNKYANSNIMGMEKVIVTLADEYYLNGLAPWADSAWMAKLKTRVMEIRPTLLGLPARNLTLYKPNGETFNIYDQEAEFTVLFFFEPHCGHCKKTTPILKEFSEEYWEKGVHVISIYTQYEKEEWENFIKEKELEENWLNGWDPYRQTNFRYYYDIKSTPMIYLLDKDKRIIGKRLDVETLKKMIDNEIRIRDMKK